MGPKYSQARLLIVGTRMLRAVAYVPKDYLFDGSGPGLRASLTLQSHPVHARAVWIQRTSFLQGEPGSGDRCGATASILNTNVPAYPLSR